MRGCLNEHRMRGESPHPDCSGRCSHRSAHPTSPRKRGEVRASGIDPPRRLPGERRDPYRVVPSIKPWWSTPLRKIERPRRIGPAQGRDDVEDIDLRLPIRLPLDKPNTPTREATPNICPLCWPSIRAPHPRAPLCFERHLDRRNRASRIPAAFSGLGLGRARAGGHLDLDHRHLPRGAEEGRRHRKGHRRDRHHQPARDHRGVGPRHRPADSSRHRLAGPPHRRHLRQAQERRPRARDLGEDRPDHRSLFLRNEGRLDPRSRPRRARRAPSAAS